MAEELRGSFLHTRWKTTYREKSPGPSHRNRPLCRLAQSCSLSNNIFVRIIVLCSILQLLFTHVQCQDGVKKYFRIDENLPVGTNIGRVDDILGFTYELATGTDYFAVDQTSGQITIKQLIDRERLPNDEVKFVVKQRSSDSAATGHTLIEVIVTIVDLNDNTPTFSSSSINHTIAENIVPLQPFTLTATDLDASINGASSLVYSIVSGNDDGFWRVTTSSAPGPKSAALALIESVDREEIDSFQLVIQARDGGNPSKSGTTVVNIFVRDLNDNHPNFDFTLYQASVKENATVGAKILQTLANDQDTGNNAALVFSITSRNSLFSMDPLTGEIRLEASLLNSGYDVEPTLCQASYCNTTLCLTVCVLEIQVVDQEGQGTNQLQDQSRVKITIEDVNNHAPVIEGSKLVTVSEDAAPGSVIFRLTINDADKGRNGEWDLTYVSGNELGHFRAPQCFLSSLCIIRTNAPIDKERVSRYELTFAATDRGDTPMSTSFSVVVGVLDANDHSPQFSASSYAAVVSELDPVNSFVAAVTATDVDEGKLVIIGIRKKL